MSLHDIDKSHGRRLNPTPNTNDKMSERPAHGTTQNHNAGEEATADGLKFLERQIVAKQDGYNKAAFGFFGEANRFGLKVAQDGEDVLTADDANLIFNSQQNTFKIAQSGTIDVTGTLNQGTFATVNHNLGYVPMVIASAHSPNFPGTNAAMLPYIETPYSSTYYVVAQIANTTSTYVSFGVYLGTSPSGHAGTWTIKYYLLQETAN